jgi:glycosyltransferase involved in cell wall biosynthesis
MKISAVIPVFNAARTLPACLAALARQEHPDYEVILVDNNSTDGSPEVIGAFLAAHPGLDARLVHEPIQGACAARNRGARQAKGEVIANIDPDCLPTPAWLAELAEAFADETAAAVAGNITCRAPENLYEVFAGLFTLPGREAAEEHREYTLTRGGFATANLAIRRSWFERLGGFDETINYRGVGIGEDHDLLARLYQQGGRLRAIPGGTVVHWHRSTLRGILRQGFLFGLAHALLTRYHGRQGILVSAAGREFLLPGPWKGWLDGDGLDKKMAILLACLSIHPLFWAALPAFVLLQVGKMARRLRRRKVEVRWGASWAMVGLMLLKSAAITTGRVRGAARHRVLCL